MNRSLAFKLLAIFIFTLVLAVALVMINAVVRERQQYRDDAVTSIAQSYAGAQTLVGPVLIQPLSKTVQTTTFTSEGKPKITNDTEEISQLTFPTKLTITGKLIPTERHHGIYRATVYTFEGEMTGSIDAPEAAASNAKATYEEPYLGMQLSDVRGIIGMPTVTVNGKPAAITQGGVIRGDVEELTAEPAGDLRQYSSLASPKSVPPSSTTHWQPNLRVRLAGAERGHKAHYDFDLKFQIAGTERLSLAPVGDLNEIDLQSTWQSPLFAGSFLPRQPKVSAEGFTANWSLSSLAAATQQQIIAGESSVDKLDITLLNPIDPYKLSDRATKYGILFVLLTFAGFFLFEMLKQLPIHPVQYLLVGFGLAIFFLLLISISEHTEFVRAYVIASAACIGLLTFYLSYVLRSKTRGLGFGAMLTALYAAVYGLLISEDNSLILGSLLLFAVLAAVMVVTRKIDWYKQGLGRPPAPLPPPVPAMPPAVSSGPAL